MILKSQYFSDTSMYLVDSDEIPPDSMRILCHFYYGPNQASKITLPATDLTVQNLVRCPFPNFPILNDFRLSLQWKNSLEDETDSFKVCPRYNITTTSTDYRILPNHSTISITTSSSSLPGTNKFKLSVCTVASRMYLSYKRIVHWIEYYRMMGVDHFFIYDTTLNITSTNNTTTSFESLGEFLKPYIEMKIVSVISWPYKGCVDNGLLACSGPILGYNNKNRNYEAVFTPPDDILFETSSLSCLLRFKEISEWIGVLKINEYVRFVPSTRNLNLKKAAVNLPNYIMSITKTSPEKEIIAVSSDSYHMCLNTYSNYERIMNYENDDDSFLAFFNTSWVKTFDSLNLKLPHFSDSILFFHACKLNSIKVITLFIYIYIYIYTHSLIIISLKHYQI